MDMAFAFMMEKTLDISQKKTGFLTIALPIYLKIKMGIFG